MLPTVEAAEIDALRDRVRANRELPPPATRRELRKRAGLSLQDIGDALGVTRTAVLFWEQGTRRPGKRTLARYADILAMLAAETAAPRPPRGPT